MFPNPSATLIAFLLLCICTSSLEFVKANPIEPTPTENNSDDDLTLTMFSVERHQFLRNTPPTTFVPSPSPTSGIIFYPSPDPTKVTIISSRTIIKPSRSPTPMSSCHNPKPTPDARYEHNHPPCHAH